MSGFFSGFVSKMKFTRGINSIPLPGQNEQMSVQINHTETGFLQSLNIKTKEAVF